MYNTNVVLNYIFYTFLMSNIEPVFIIIFWTMYLVREQLDAYIVLITRLQ